MKKLILLLAFITISFFNVKAQYTKLYDFDNINGKTPNGTLVSDGTFLYGMTNKGGTGPCPSGCGTIFKIKPDGTGYAKILDFNNTNGSGPHDCLIFDGIFLYGMTAGGGIYNGGTIFKIKPDGTGHVKLHDFSGNPGTNGYKPFGSLISVGTFLYGMTNSGGTGACPSGCGTIFKMKSDGTSYSILHNFTPESVSGNGPNGSLIFDGTFLYGMTPEFGTNNLGNLFKIKPDGTGYLKILDFASATNGSHPLGSLISDGTFLYGMTSRGGITDSGTIFKIKPDGSAFTKLIDFTGTANGKVPLGSLFSDGTFLYGMTTGGGTIDGGTIFKIKPDGSSYSMLLDLASSTNGTFPFGSLISDGNYLYGITPLGGINNNGTIFKLGIPTGIIENNENNGFKVYPNPCNGTFTIATKENGYQLIIINILGEKIYQAEIKNQKSEIDFCKLPKGIYFVKIYYGKGIYTEKLVVQ